MKHVIYIPHLGQENMLSQQLAHAFAKHHCDMDKEEKDTTMIVQYGSNLKPLELITPTDVLQIMFTPIQNLHAPLHAQTNAKELLEQVPMLIHHLLHDGLNPDGCTIQLYTLEHSDQNADIVKEIANHLVAISKTKNVSVEWHIIPMLSQLDREQLNQIFQPNITCHGAIHAIVQDSGEVKLIETSGLSTRSGEFH